jgi:hypothetical protein
VQRPKPIGAPRVSQLFNNDLLPTDIVIIEATKSLFWPNHQEPFLTGGLKDLSIDNTLLSEALHLWNDGFSEETSIRLSEHLLLVSELSREHLGSLLL